MSEKSIKEQVAEAMDYVAEVERIEAERIAAIRAEVEAAEKARLEARDPLKIGERAYTRVGGKTPLYVIVGSPRLKGERWLSLAPKDGGPMYAVPEATFFQHFWEPNG
ncbi:hypothetical protein SEA_MUSETTA_79 [Microbacterium phage Musetta]|nr:hypothetical protein SEA_FORK_75 [Microbacterium phage Fork]AXH50234.1 hypothetical protein SEA_MUSETTA_79 [Microbacterium phage Musetta]